MATDKTSEIPTVEVTDKGETDEVPKPGVKAETVDDTKAEMKDTSEPAGTDTAEVKDTEKPAGTGSAEEKDSKEPAGTGSAEAASVESPPSSPDKVEEKVSEPEKKEVKPAESQPPESEGPKLLDLAFAMDCTGSMGSYIHQAQQNIRKIVEDIVAKEQADVRLALVEYRDHPPQDSSFVTNVHDFTSSVREMKGWLDGCSANGGGDGPEAVADALHQVLKLNWRQPATKICVFISDAPPHGLGMDSGDGFPNGCPDGLDPMEIAGKLAEKSITLYLVGCEPSINRYREFFMALAHVTGGQYVPLGKAQLLTAVITGGAQEELSLQRLMEDVNQEVQQELADADEGAYSHRDLSKRIHSKMASKGYKTKNLHMNASRMPKISTTAESMSYCKNLADVRTKMPSSAATDDWGDVTYDLPESRARHRSKKKSKSAKGLPPPKATAAKSEDRSSVWGWGDKLTETVSGWFGSSKKAESEKEPPAETERKAPAAAAAPSVPRATHSDTYDVVEEDIGEEQVYRMVQKSLMKQNLRSKTRPEEED